MIPLLDFLKIHYPDTSLSTLRQWLKWKRIEVEGKIFTDSRIEVPSGARMKLLPKDQPLEEEIKILFSDSHLVVVDKPEGLLSVASETKKQSVHHILKKHFHPKKVSVIHRLDEGTSGVMIFTFSDAAYKSLKDQFKDHSIERVYIGVVEGVFPEKPGRWDSYLIEDKTLKVSVTKDRVQGERAITHYERIGVKQGYSTVRFRLETGKKNQIRVQSQAAGYPIAGDEKYGAQTNPLGRLALHAQLLSFIHPTTQKKMTFLSEPPKNFF